MITLKSLHPLYDRLFDKAAPSDINYGCNLQSTVLLGIANLTQLAILTQSTVLTFEDSMAIPVNLIK